MRMRRALGFKLLAEKIYASYMSQIPKERQAAIGLDPIGDMQRRALNELLDQERGLEPQARAVLRSKLGLPGETACTARAIIFDQCQSRRRDPSLKTSNVARGLPVSYPDRSWMKKKHGDLPIKVGLISLGCAKNLVDAEIMLGNLLKGGLEMTNDAAQADVMIVNTCSFIDAAQEESVDTILESAELA